MNRSPAKACLLPQPKLVRSGGHYFPGVPSLGMTLDDKVMLPGISITEDAAVDEIYRCFEGLLCAKCASDWIVNGRGNSIIKNNKEEEEEADINPERFTCWQNEFLYHYSGQENVGNGRVGLVWSAEDDSLFSEGIIQLREKTHIVFKNTNYGVLWKILPRSVISVGNVFDGCFTKNHDNIMDIMNLVNQNEQFGTFLDITKETTQYLLWTTFA
jgi:hypothetical protein